MYENTRKPDSLPFDSYEGYNINHQRESNKQKRCQKTSTRFSEDFVPLKTKRFGNSFK